MTLDVEHVVIGCGGIGSAACYWLARSGADVLGLEQHQLGHDRGGSQDHSRIIRLSYHADAYAVLAPAAYEAWETLEQESGLHLLYRTGGLDLVADDADGRANLERFAAVMSAHDVAFDRLTGAEVSARWPQFALGAGELALYQEQTGFVDARRANAAHVALARAHGATVLDRTPVGAIELTSDGARVRTADETFTCRSVVLASGAWTNRLLSQLGRHVPITVTKEQVTYFATPHLAEFVPERFPVWIWHGQDDFYGLPIHGEVATKAAVEILRHAVDPETRDFEADADARALLTGFLAERIPRSLGPELYTKTCLYTMPPDRDFVLGVLPEAPQVALAVGAAHAFKFAGLLGRILSELARDGRTRFPIDAFGIDRPTLQSERAGAAIDFRL
ncbi:MAG: N-methyl-L-tryptophan oxidase [Egibacteraceae bacterium]